MTKGYAVIKDGKVISGSLTYADVSKYMGAIDQMRANGHQDQADTTMNLMVETGHPLALVAKADELLKRGIVGDGTTMIQRAKATGDIDAILNWASWVLRDRIVGDVDEALAALEDVAKKGYPHLIVAAPGYFLRNIAKGLDHVENNIGLNKFLTLWNPKGYAQVEKGKLSQRKFLEPIEREAGLEWRGD